MGLPSPSLPIIASRKLLVGEEGATETATAGAGTGFSGAVATDLGATEEIIGIKPAKGWGRLRSLWTLLVFTTKNFEDLTKLKFGHFYFQVPYKLFFEKNKSHWKKKEFIKKKSMFF